MRARIACVWEFFQNLLKKSRFFYIKYLIIDAIFAIIKMILKLNQKGR